MIVAKHQNNKIFIRKWNKKKHIKVMLFDIKGFPVISLKKDRNNKILEYKEFK